MKSRPLALVLAAALVAVGAGLAVIGLSLPAGGVEVVSAAQPVNPGAADPRDFAAHNSPTIARNPTRPSNVVVVNRVDAPIFSCGLHVSLNGGTTWTPGKIPFPAGEELPERCYAPDATFDSNGTLYVSFVTLKGLGNTPNAAWVASSDDGGRTLSAPMRALGPLAFQVKLAADPVAAGRLYLTWLQAERTANIAFADAGNPIMAARSDDGGATWSDPEQVNPPGRLRVLAPSVVATADTQYVLYLDVGEDALDYHGGHEGRGGPPYEGKWSLVLARSVDRGGTWRETVVDDGVVPTQRFIALIPPSPSLAVDGERNRVYAGFHDGRHGDPDVRVWASTDGGDSFNAGVRVNDSANPDRTAQYLSTLALAPSGRLDVVYFDRRADGSDAMNEVSLQSSSDGASTFGSRLTLSDRAFDSRIGPGGERDLPDLGSHLGLVSSDDQAIGVWTDTRAGTPASAKQDLGRAVAAFSDPSPLRRALPPLGGLLALAGLVLALSGLRTRLASKTGMGTGGEEKNGA